MILHWFAVGDPRGVRCCYGYGDSFLQVHSGWLRLHVTWK